MLDFCLKIDRKNHWTLFTFSKLQIGVVVFFDKDLQLVTEVHYCLIFTSNACDLSMAELCVVVVFRGFISVVISVECLEDED